MSSYGVRFLRTWRRVPSSALASHRSGFFGKTKRIEADRRCAIGIVDFDLQRGLLQHVGMRGTASLVPLDDDRLYRLLRRYLGEDRDAWDPRFKEHVIDGLDLIVRFVPGTVVANDQSYFKGGQRS